MRVALRGRDGCAAETSVHSSHVWKRAHFARLIEDHGAQFAERPVCIVNGSIGDVALGV